MNYNVHIFAIVRVRRTEIEADSQEEAIKKAEETTDLNKIFPYHEHDGIATEYADDIDCFHVDEENDPEFKNSTWYDKHGVPL